MTAPTTWTGADACRLQAALRLTNEGFAEALGVATRTVAKWRANPAMAPTAEMQRILDTAFTRATDTERERWTSLDPNPVPQPRRPEDGVDDAAHERLVADPHIGSAMEWLDRAAGWSTGAARDAVAAELSRIRPRDLHDRAARRGAVGQRAIANALADYYGAASGGLGTYGARVGPNYHAFTSVLTRPEWLDLACTIPGPHDALELRRDHGTTTPSLDNATAHAGARRLAGTLAVGGRLVNRPLYRLVSADVATGRINGSLAMTTFAAYALTLDLVEGELLDALAAGGGRGTPLPLRDQLLPTLAAVLDTPVRLCAGGVLALCAIARPSGDHVLLVQERSGAVLNAARTLAVVPKGFHQPLTDPRGDTSLGRTLWREMEEELFGRPDVDNTTGDARAADPMHPTRLSEPMRWLIDHPDAWRCEGTAFGLNLVSGNFEFPALIAIHDPTFWNRHGGTIEANWESSTLHLYSSSDHDGLAELIAEIGWSNEGLFALLEGLRRLAALDPDRVNCPTIAGELSG